MSLRRIRESDLDQLFEWRNDPLIYKWCRQYGPLHWSDHEHWLMRQVSDPKLDMFAITNEISNLVGVCGLTDIDFVNSRAEFSLYIGPTHQGRGYAKKALISLFSWGFNTLGLNRIWGETFEENSAALLFKAIGMEFDGIRREHYFRDGCFIDAHLYSVGAKCFNHLHHSD